MGADKYLDRIPYWLAYGKRIFSIDSIHTILIYGLHIRLPPYQPGSEIPLHTAYLPICLPLSTQIKKKINSFYYSLNGQRCLLLLKVAC